MSRAATAQPSAVTSTFESQVWVDSDTLDKYATGDTVSDPIPPAIRDSNSQIRIGLIRQRRERLGDMERLLARVWAYLLIPLITQTGNIAATTELQLTDNVSFWLLLVSYIGTSIQGMLNSGAFIFLDPSVRQAMREIKVKAKVWYDQPTAATSRVSSWRRRLFRGVVRILWIRKSSNPMGGHLANPSPLRPPPSTAAPLHAHGYCRTSSDTPVPASPLCIHDVRVRVPTDIRTTEWCGIDLTSRPLVPELPLPTR